MSSSPVNTHGKDYLLFNFVRDGDEWTHARMAELIAPQDELKKVVKKKEGNALPQLQKMGHSRRQQINDLARQMTAQESGDVVWEPVVIKTIKDYRAASGKMSVVEFNVLFARRGRKSDPSTRVKIVKEPKAAETKEVKKTEKPKKYQRTSELNDPFNSTQLFDPTGRPMDSRGPIPYENAGLAPGIGADRPIGFKPPPVVPKAAAIEDAIPPLGGIPGLGNLDDLFGPELIPGKIDGIVDMPEDHVREPRHSESRHGHRTHRRSSGVPEEYRHSRHNVKYVDHYPSSRSSWASDESAIMGDWSDLSSRSSEESYYPSPRGTPTKLYRTIDPGRKYYYRDSRLQPGNKVVVEPARRPRLAIENRRESVEFVERLPRRSTQPRPTTVHQNFRSQSREEFLPEVPNPPSYHTREQSEQRYVDRYMREREKEEAGQRTAGTPRYNFDPREYRQSNAY